MATSSRRDDEFGDFFDIDDDFDDILLSLNENESLLDEKNDICGNVSCFCLFLSTKK